MFKLVRMDNLEKTNIKFTKSHNLSDIKMKDSNDTIVHVKLYENFTCNTQVYGNSSVPCMAYALHFFQCLF